MDSVQILNNVLDNVVQNRATQRALARASKRFAEKYPQWAQYMFDAHFVDTRIAPRLANGDLPGVTTLVNLWAEQMAWPQEQSRQRTITGLTPAARDFLQMLESELAFYARVGAVVADTL